MNEKLERLRDTTKEFDRRLTVPDYNNLQPHPHAELMPMIEGKQRDDLKADIAKNGVLQKIVLYRGYEDGTTGAARILDGQNRYRAARECGIEFTADAFEEFSGTWLEAKNYVLSLNFHRRQLTSKQQNEIIEGMIRENPDMSARQIARLVGISSHSRVGDIKKKMNNATDKEDKEFNKFKDTWDKLTYDRRLEFVREFAPDIREMLA
jgi:hypothetical protein